MEIGNVTQNTKHLWLCNMGNVEDEAHVLLDNPCYKGEIYNPLKVCNLDMVMIHILSQCQSVIILRMLRRDDSVE